MHLVVCGGSALIALGLVSRTTRDLDVLALAREGRLVAPVPLPPALVVAAEAVAKVFGLPRNWLNNGPSSGEGGLFQVGMPEGLQDRLVTCAYGPALTVSFIARADQIPFKLWASVDRGGYHIDDLLKLQPTAEEIRAAALWTLEKDVSEGYRMVLGSLLTELGYADVARSLV
ncbi:hypothetical protein METEAL_05200 [Mesoterricola silvestris]|uniref:Uncharacterized protein n=1 Tax=Mesoterricola silvestris TaxID=2927979 RepID=A0AA48K7N9_9BACT|nr:hypothetical protein METEAL_05200 [Mesoterricola silvestris]